MENKNALIADFMGWEKIEGTERQYQVPGLFPYSDYAGWVIKDPEEMHFHRSWDWLMPVIENISRIPIEGGNGPNDTCHPITFAMPDEEGNVMFRFKGGFLSKAPTLIDAAYNAVIEFIEHRRG